MAVKIRLTRRGRKKRPVYDIIVANSTAPRDGKYIEKIGSYNPLSNPATILLDDTKALQWLLNGAQPTDTVKAMLSYRGILMKKHLQIGVIKGAITQEQADKKFDEWMNSKTEKIESKKSSIAKTQSDAKKAAMDAETKKKEARVEAIKAKQAAAIAATEVAPATEEAPANEEAPVTDAPAAESTEETQA
jgi:small subunit ribosomal protein S16